MATLGSKSKIGKKFDPAKTDMSNEYRRVAVSIAHFKTEVFAILRNTAPD